MPKNKPTIGELLPLDTRIVLPHSKGLTGGIVVDVGKHRVLIVPDNREMSRADSIHVDLLDYEQGYVVIETEELIQRREEMRKLYDTSHTP